MAFCDYVLADDLLQVDVYLLLIMSSDVVIFSTVMT